MAKVRISLELEVEDLKQFTTGFFNSELWEQTEVKVPEELELFTTEVGEDVEDSCKMQTLTGMVKKGPNWNITFTEYPKKWVIPCHADGRGNRDIAEKFAAFFIDDMDTDESHATKVVFKEPVRCHINMQRAARGKFPGEWVWNKVTRN